jgi:hypothetical protein
MTTHDDRHHRETPGRDPHLLTELARWLEVRLHETVGWTEGSRLYGLSVLDRDALTDDGDRAARIVFLGSGDVYELLDGESARHAVLFDAMALCCFGVATELDTGIRRRCRTVLVADHTGQATVNRMRGRPAEPLGVASGPVADLVARLFVPESDGGDAPVRVA